MSITFQCDCGKKLQVADHYAGKKGRCPSCGATLDIPDESNAEVPSKELRASDFDAAFDEYSDPDDRERDRRKQETYDVRDEDDEEPIRRQGRRYQEEEDYDEDEEGEVTTHTGGSIPRAMDFFAKPPEEIGPVVTAYSTLRKKDKPMEPGARMGMCVGIGVGGLVLGLILGLLFKSPPTMVILGLILGGGAFAISFFCTRFVHTCTFVGRDGIAKYVCRGARRDVAEEWFLFEDATEIRTSQTRQYLNGGYQGTNYTFAWHDLGGRCCFSLAGTYQSEEGNPPEKDLFHFGNSAETSWTIYLLNQVQAQLKTSGSIFFPIKGKNWVRLAEEMIILNWNGETSEHHADEIAEVRIQEGWFEIRRHDAQKGWFSSSGIYRFPYSELGNARLFLVLMREVVGIEFNA